MIVPVRMFAIAKQLAGSGHVDLELPTGANICDLRRELARQVPALASHMDLMLFAVGANYAQDETVLESGTDVACIPPVSGG